MAAVRLMSCRPSLLVLCSLYLFWMLSIHVPRAGSLSFNFSFSRPQSPDLPQLINVSGDAYFSPDTIELTRNSRVNSVGRATYVQKVPLWDGATGELASFTTTFYFNISRDNPSASYAGDGMAFFLGHPEAGIPANSSGGSLGLVPVSHGGGIVAVEFDTFLNPENSDISYSHVGIDVNSVNSTASTDATTPTKNLKSGYNMMAAVSYENGTKLLNAELTINDTRFNVNATIDLRSYLPEYVVVGFSAATGELTELHKVLAWSFSSTLEPTKTPTAVIAPAPPPLSPDIVVPSKKSKARVGSSILTPVLVPLLFLLACAAGLVLWQKHKRRRPGGDGISSDSDYGQGDETAELARGVAASGPKRYAYRELAAATNNFAEGEKLGRGGFGSVYRGKLVGEEERAVAIKMFSSESSAQGRKEFEAEVRIISRLKHRNLVQLLGWSDSRNGLLLVYELVAQGSLDKHLHSSERWLTWPERYQIILGLGSALRYLHHEWEQCVVHGDIKPSNIMLDDTHGTKLGDFGLARLGDHGGRWHTTKAVLGTAGYIDPEFVNTRHPSTQSDVYSFGIVLLEIVSGRPPVILQEGGPPPFVLLKWVWGLYGREKILDAADERLRGGDDERCMERVLIVGLWCAHPDQSERPSMVQAMHVLQSEDARLPELPQQMYYRTSSSGFAITGRASGALSIESYSGDSSATTTTTGDSKHSSGSSTTALLRDSKERA
ncbi:unnamed protein product [Urochloa humidicola]